MSEAPLTTTSPERVELESEGFANTGEHRRFAEFCDAVLRYRYIGVCVGAPGVGKTRSGRRYAQWELLEPLFPRYAYQDELPSEIAGCQTVFYTPPTMNTPKLLTTQIQDRRMRLSWLVSVAMKASQRTAHKEILAGFEDRTKLLIVDEAQRLKTRGFEHLRDMYDREGFGLVLIGMPGLEKELSRYPQLYSRVGFVHRYKALEAGPTRRIIEAAPQLLGVSLSAEALTDDSIAAITRITGGNFRLIQRLMQQIELIMEANEGLATVTPEVVNVAREGIVIGTG